MAEVLPVDQSAPHYRVAVLGGGMSGICMGIELRKRGIGDFIILEKADSVGGTWRENQYPGVACDVPSHVYSFSFELNPDWKHAYSSGEEIWRYCERCAKKYGLEPHLNFGWNIEQIQFDGKRWQVRATDGRHLSADVVVSGLGGLHLPNHADIKGLDEYNGRRFHTAQWDNNHDLTDKHVAVIGTGASAAQTVPAIADKVASITVFQRSAAWVFPRLARDIPEERRKLFRRHKWLMRGYRWFLWGFMDLMGILSLRRGGLMADRLKRSGLEHLTNSVKDPEIRKQLTPDYEPGCKRRVISDDYLSTFNKANVYLETTPIEGIEANGVRTTDGALHAVDTIIEATGFRPFDITDYVDVEGRDGVKLRDVWSERVESLRTMMVPGFPNFFMLLGPNSATGHTSALIMIESQANYAAKCLALMDKHGMAHLDPDPQVVAQYNERLQRDLKKMVFDGGCNSWYTDENDRNFTLWPYSALRFLFEQRQVKLEEFRT